MNDAAIRVATEIASSLKSTASFLSRFKGQSAAEPLEPRILKAVNVLNHRDRSQVAVILGQLSARSAQLGATVRTRIGSLSEEERLTLERALEKMESGEFYQRYFGFYSVFGSKDPAKVARGLYDRSE